MKYKLAVIGSRNFNNYNLLSSTLNKYKDKISHIVSGGARGADDLSERWANENDIPTIIFLADWNTHGKKAGMLRNHDIIKECDACIAFWDGESNGTKHSISLCESKYNKPIKIINF